MKIYLMQAEHFHVPGIIRAACATMEIAVREAVAAVAMIAEDSPVNIEGDITADNWEAVISRLQDYHGAQYCYAEIHELELKGEADG